MPKWMLVFPAFADLSLVLVVVMCAATDYGRSWYFMWPEGLLPSV